MIQSKTIIAAALVVAVAVAVVVAVTAVFLVLVRCHLHLFRGQYNVSFPTELLYSEPSVGVAGC